LVENDTWELVDPPKGCKIIGSQCIFTKKVNEYGLPVKYKGHIVAQSFFQIEGIDYFKTFVPVPQHPTLCLLLTLSLRYNLKMGQIDIKNAYLNGILAEEIFRHQPKNYEIPGHEHQVYQLKKMLYRLNQSGHKWY
jgi:hypothetical protein